MIRDNAIRDNIANALGALGELIDKELDEFEAKAEERNAKLADELEECGEDLEKAIKEAGEYRDEVGDAVAFWAKVEAEQIGWLEIGGINKALAFEKLKERWEGLTAYQLQCIEDIVEGNFI